MSERDQETLERERETGEKMEREENRDGAKERKRREIRMRKNGTYGTSGERRRERYVYIYLNE